MAKQLEVIAGPDKGRVFDLAGVDTLLLGRSRRCKNRLADPHVSRVHCQVRADGDEVFVSDTLSTGGTFVNGRRILRESLRPGDVLRVGKTELMLRVDGLPRAPAGAAGAEGSSLFDSRWAAAQQMREPDPAAVAALAELVGHDVGKYRVGAVLDVGKSGLVFVARNKVRDRVVALKVLWPGFADDDDRKKRFVRAMRTSSCLRHPNVVRVYRAGKERGLCWVAMEYIEAMSAARLIRQVGADGRLDWRPTLGLGMDIARALAFAHGQGVIHRNVTPNNILVSSRRRTAKLGDLMLAKAMEGCLAEPITKAGQVLGDLPYLSPEQTRGTQGLDARTDLYSLGATLYALLTGRPPFTGDGPLELIDRIRREEPLSPREVQMRLSTSVVGDSFHRKHVLLQLEPIPEPFERAVLRLLAKRPEDRYESAAELLADLEMIAPRKG